MDSHWNDNQPIYRQLRDKVVAMILEGTLADGDALPSVRSVAAEFTLNALTVLKGGLTYLQMRWIEQGSQGVAYDLRKAIHAAGLPRTQFWRNLVGLAVLADSVSDLAERAVT